MADEQYTLTGRIAIKGDERKVSEKFRVKELIVDTDNGQYSQLIKFEFTNDNIAKLDNIRTGTMVKVHFNIKGRKSGENYFNQLVGWKIDLI